MRSRESDSSSSLTTVRANLRLAIPVVHRETVKERIANIGFARTSPPSLRVSSEAGGGFWNVGWVWEAGNTSELGCSWRSIRDYEIVVFLTEYRKDWI